MSTKLDNKIKLKELNETKYNEIEFNGQKIVVKSNMDKDDKIWIYTEYARIFFNEDGDSVSNYLSAKYSFVLAVIGLCTNIETEDVDLDAVLNSGLWGKIVSNIENFSIVSKDLYGLIKMISEERLARKTVGATIDNLASSIMEFVGQLDKGSIEALMDDFRKEVKRMEENGLILPEKMKNTEESKEQEG